MKSGMKSADIKGVCVYRGVQWLDWRLEEDRQKKKVESGKEEQDLGGKNLRDVGTDNKEALENERRSTEE